ncbi:hypothetical protein [Alkalihalobacillus sp. AL-G]|uniref:hypothetical protein n=1 Tax=Alkalihalobacillus sp. AL-G TaxID=2926399 RepID=UPI00272CD9D0|nr:hypothetical protein [Alkalihalobacillus sp. AL-G]WLD91513.1 hypothetical protein MOJ78_10675 [Alkalihalobacillus sp. AL-G]
MIRRLNGDYISYIRNRKICLTYLYEDIGELSINNKVIAKCPYSYTKAAIERIENKMRAQKVYVPDDEILFRELKVGTLINFTV